MWAADCIIVVGREAGEGGGYVVAAGTPEEVATQKAEGKKQKVVSHTAIALEPVLAAGPFEVRKIFDFAAAEAKREGDLNITQVGETAKMPWEADGRKWHTVNRVGRTGEPCEWDGKILERIV